MDGRRGLRRLWHLVRARPRLTLSVAAAAAVFLALPPSLPPSTRALVTWDAGAACYLTMAWILMSRASMAHMKWRARIEDDGAAAVLALTVAAAIASLAAIVLELSGVKALPAAREAPHLALAGVTFAASWLLVHTAFALHYAHAYHAFVDGGGNPPLDFPRQDDPGYLDFLYFSVVVGMTSQTADVALCSTRMRRLVMTHGLVAFVFNASLLALAINIAAGLLG